MKTKQVISQPKFLEENHNIKSDHSLIDNLRALINLVLNTGGDIEKGDNSVKYRKGGVCDGLLESIIGHVFDFEDIAVTETNSLQYGENKNSFSQSICK